MKKNKISTNTRDEKNSDTGITLKKIKSTISVPDNKEDSETIDLEQSIPSRISSTLSVPEEENKETVTNFIPLKTRTVKKKIIVNISNKDDLEDNKINFNEIKRPKISLFENKDEASIAQKNKDELTKEKDVIIKIKKMKIDADEKETFAPVTEAPIEKEVPKEQEKTEPKIEEKPIVPIKEISKEIFDELDKPAKKSSSLDKPSIETTEPKIEEKPIIPITKISKEIFDELDKSSSLSLPPIDKPETKLLQEEPEIIPTQEPVIIPQELPLIVPQELPEVIPQELPAEIYDFKPDNVHELPSSIPLDKLPETLEKQFHEKHQKDLQERMQVEIESLLKERYTKSDLKNVTVVLEPKKEVEKINEEAPKPEVKIIVVEDINKLLQELDKRTKTLISDDAMLEEYSFKGVIPKVSKISYKTYNIQNLYSKIDDLSKIARMSLSNASEKKEETSNKSIPSSPVPSTSRERLKNELNADAIIEELIIPEIIPIKDNITDIDNLVNNKFSESTELRQENVQIPTFVDSKSGPELNKKVEDNLKRINENKIKKEQNNKHKQNQPKPKEINIFVESKKVAPSTPTSESKPQEPDPRISLLEKELKEEKDRFDSFINKEKSRPIEVKAIESQAPKLEPKPENEIYIKKDYVPVAPGPGKEMSYILPKDARTNTTANAGFVGQEGVYSTPHAFNFDKNRMQSLVYSIPMNVLDSDVTKVFEKYSLDDFTYVTISYIKGKGLFYNMVQLELTPEQNKVFYEIKKIFFNSIDQNYYTFNGDKYTLDQYTQKIFDIALSKLSYQVNALDKKLYYKFIQREFSGLGILTALLSDKKVLEVSCAGEKTSVIVYHMTYGTLETNINFDNINKLNQFVLLLTKNMGLYVNSAHPIIEGYLPNGYKVEGLFSAGDLSSKGSSFVIKKYLEAPITPVSLIKSGVGTIDVFAYIWSAINEDYKIILTGDDTSFIFLNSVGLLYPDKKIISIQSYDRIKLPQKQWIKRVVTGSEEVDKKTIIQHTIAERPDYIFVDEFGSDVFDVPWYSINLFYVNYNQIPQLRENIRQMGQKAIIIELKKLKIGFNETTQITQIEEIVDRNDFITIELSSKDKEYHINLLSSAIDIVNFNKRKKYMRWLNDSNILDYRDFNNIISEFSVNEEKVVKRLGIDQFA